MLVVGHNWDLEVLKVIPVQIYDILHSHVSSMWAVLISSGELTLQYWWLEGHVD
jgi:hypothetical protein